jgi:hypothetical protein
LNVWERERGESEWLVRKIEEQEQKTKWRWERKKVNGLRRLREWDRAARLAPWYMADMDEMLKKAQAGGSAVGGEKVWSLAFGDDLVIVAKSDREIREMKKNLGKDVRKKKLEANAEKTKMMEKKVMGCLQE